jgi:thymidylate kinase
MKIVLALEGTDGAGKSTLARFLKRLCEQQDQPITLIGRRGTLASPQVSKLSHILTEEEHELVPPAEICVRVAREFQRAFLAAQAPPGVVVLDRFILSVVGLMRIYGLDVQPLLPLLKEVIARAYLHATIFVKCPFDVAASRVKNRNPQAPAKGHRGERINRRLAEVIEEEFQRGILTGQQWLVDNSQTQQVAEEQLVGHLLPYFVKR